MGDCRGPQGADPWAIRYVFPAPAWEKSIDLGEINIQNQELVTQNSEVSSQTEVRCWWKFNCLANQRERVRVSERGGGGRERQNRSGWSFPKLLAISLFPRILKAKYIPREESLGSRGSCKVRTMKLMLSEMRVLQHLAWEAWGSDHYLWDILPAAAERLWARDPTHGIRNGLICFSYQTG